MKPCLILSALCFGAVIGVSVTCISIGDLPVIIGIAEVVLFVLIWTMGYVSGGEK